MNPSLRAIECTIEEAAKMNPPQLERALQHVDRLQVAPDSWTAMALVAAEIDVSLTLSTVAANAPTPKVAFVPVADATVPVELRMAWRSDVERSAALDIVLRLAETVLPTPRT